MQGSIRRRGSLRMSLCVVCAQPTLGHDDVCAFHLFGQGDDWATGNRIMCDFLHRGMLRPTPRERADALEFLVGALEEEGVGP
jgi:hypothetical protein